MANLGLHLRGVTDYTQETTSRDIPIVINGTKYYISKPLTTGNSKLANTVLIFDLLAGSSCENCIDCVTSCYAIKAQRQYPDTYNRRAILTWLANNDIKTLQRLLVLQLNKTKRTIVRIHSSGDFVSQQYIDMWSRIVEIFPQISFYYYTKVDHLFDFSELKSWGNCNEVKSILPDGSLNYGNGDYLKEKIKLFPNINICPDGIQPDVKCGLTCTACLSQPYMLFLQH